MEFEKTNSKPIVPTNRVRARQDWADQVYKTETASGDGASETAEIHKQSYRCWWAPRRSKSELLSALLAEQDIPHNLLNAKPEKWSGIRNRCSGGPCRCRHHRHQHGGPWHRHHSGGQQRLHGAAQAARGVLRAGQFEDDHKPPVPPQKIRCRLFRGCAISSASNRESLYPCILSDDTDQALGQLRDLAKVWGDRALSVIELEERIATAREGTHDDPQIQALRAAIVRQGRVRQRCRPRRNAGAGGRRPARDRNRASRSRRSITNCVAGQAVRATVRPDLPLARRQPAAHFWR